MKALWKETSILRRKACSWLSFSMTREILLENIGIWNNGETAKYVGAISKPGGKAKVKKKKKENRNLKAIGGERGEEEKWRRPQKTIETRPEELERKKNLKMKKKKTRSIRRGWWRIKAGQRRRERRRKSRIEMTETLAVYEEMKKKPRKWR